MTLLDILSVTALSGFVASIVTLLGKGFIDWLNNKRDEQKTQREKLDKLVKRIFFLLDDLDREIDKIRLILLHGLKSDKKELCEFFLNINDLANNKIIRELEYIFDIKIFSIICLDVNKIGKFWEHSLILIREDLINEKYSFEKIKPEAKYKAYSYEELELFLDNALDDPKVKFGEFYNIFRLYFFAFRQKTRAFLAGLSEENKLTFRPKNIREIPDFIRFARKKV